MYIIPFSHEVYVNQIFSQAESFEVENDTRGQAIRILVRYNKSLLPAFRAWDSLINLSSVTDWGLPYLPIFYEHPCIFYILCLCWPDDPPTLVT